MITSDVRIHRECRVQHLMTLSLRMLRVLFALDYLCSRICFVLFSCYLELFQIAKFKPIWLYSFSRLGWSDFRHFNFLVLQVFSCLYVSRALASREMRRTWRELVLNLREAWEDAYHEPIGSRQGCPWPLLESLFWYFANKLVHQARRRLRRFERWDGPDLLIFLGDLRFV